MILLDTHIWVWWVTGETNSIPKAELELLVGMSGLAVSAICCLEVAWLVRKGRIALDIPLGEWFELALSGSGVQLIPLSPAIAMRAANLPEHHKDPADRLIIATAVELQAPLVSVDGSFKRYGELGTLLRPAMRHPT